MNEVDTNAVLHPMEHVLVAALEMMQNINTVPSPEDPSSPTAPTQGHPVSREKAVGSYKRNKKEQDKETDTDAEKQTQGANEPKSEDAAGGSGAITQLHSIEWHSKSAEFTDHIPKQNIFATFIANETDYDKQLLSIIFDAYMIDSTSWTLNHTNPENILPKPDLINIDTDIDKPSPIILPNIPDSAYITVGDESYTLLDGLQYLWDGISHIGNQIYQYIDSIVWVTWNPVLYADKLVLSLFPESGHPYVSVFTLSTDEIATLQQKVSEDEAQLNATKASLQTQQTEIDLSKTLLLGALTFIYQHYTEVTSELAPFYTSGAFQGINDGIAMTLWGSIPQNIQPKDISLLGDKLELIIPQIQEINENTQHLAIDTAKNIIQAHSDPHIEIINFNDTKIVLENKQKILNDYAEIVAIHSQSYEPFEDSSFLSASQDDTKIALVQAQEQFDYIANLLAELSDSITKSEKLEVLLNKAGLLYSECNHFEEKWNNLESQKIALDNLQAQIDLRAEEIAHFKSQLKNTDTFLSLEDNDIQFNLQEPTSITPASAQSPTPLTFYSIFQEPELNFDNLHQADISNSSIETLPVAFASPLVFSPADNSDIQHLALPAAPELITHYMEPEVVFQ